MPRDTLSGIVRVIVVIEVMLCFAIPAYFLFWGVLTLPVWFIGASSGAGFAAIHALSTVGGCLGIWAIVRALRFYLARRPVAPPNWTVLVLFSIAGIASIWTEMTGQFAGFELDGFTAISLIAPTLCTIHILFLAMRKRDESAAVIAPDNRPESASEG